MAHLAHHETPLIVLADPDHEASAREMIQSITAAWPGFAPAPQIDVRSPARFKEDDPGPNALGVLACRETLGPDADMGMIHSRLWDLSLPAVLVADVDADWARRLSGQGVIVVGEGTEIPVVAAIVATLCERQRSVRMIRGELSAARRCTTGLSRVMDQLHEELRLAGLVQRELMPVVLPEMPDVEAQIVFRSAGYVSGDIYDVRRIDEQRTSFFVADACGHGVPAALMTMIIARGLRLEPTPGAEGSAPSPAAILRELNTELVERAGDTARFATAVCGVIEHGSRRVTIAGAGHPPPLLIGADGSADPVKTDGGMLGVFTDEPFTERTVTLEPDQLLVLYTDGFDVAFPDRGEGGALRRRPTENYLECFRDIARVWRDGSLDDAAKTLERSLDFQAGSLHQADDLTALLFAPLRMAGEGSMAA